MLTTEILIIFFLLLLNGFFALSELAVVSASKPLLRQMARQGDRRAAAVLDLSEDAGMFLSSVQIGITLVGILAGAYGGAAIADKLAPGFNEIAFLQPHGEIVAVALVVGLITYFSVVIGELVPKQLALSNPERLAMIVARPMRLLSLVCRPLVKLLDVSAALLLRLLGIRAGDPRLTEAELQAVLAEGAEHGAIEKSEHEMLRRIIRLGDRDIRSIMTHRTEITFIDVGEGPETLRRKVHEAGHSRYPVTDGGFNNVIGVVQSKDLLDDALSTLELDPRRHLCEAHFLTEHMSCLHALELFKQSDMHMAVIVDEYGATVGIVTPSDLLEAIVGAMPGNYGQEHAQIVQREDGSWLVDGMTPIDEIHLSIGLEDIRPEGEYETIAGFVLQRLGRSPEEGDVVEAARHRFEIVDMDGRRIDKLLISPLAEEPR